MKKAHTSHTSQAMHLLHTGHDIQSLKGHTISPIEVSIPEKKKQHKKHHPVYINNSVIKKETVVNRVLDGFALLEATGLGFPEDSRRAVVTEQGYNSVVVEDLLFFSGLLYLDVSDNRFDLRCFEQLPRLTELRIVCNCISDIENINGFPRLQYLDISYNKLTADSVQSLDAIKNLRDLDLSGNELNRLPPAMYKFQCLERLLLEHNKISDNNIFFDLCDMPKLRELSLAYNLISCIPPETCIEGKFRVLDTLDLASNYIGTESALEPCIDLPRLLSLMIYGNPVLGATGEDPSGIYVEELIEAAIAARDGYTLRPLDIITEAPRKRVLRRGGLAVGRHATYKDFSIVQVDNEMETLKKTAREFKEEGKKTLFSQAVDIARKHNLTTPTEALSLKELDFDSTTFLTGMNSETAHKKATRENAVADSVMAEVAADMNLNDTSDLDKLKRKMRGEKLPSVEQQNVPQELFSRSMTEASTLTTYPLAMNTAIRSLRYAIQHPLTNHDEVPSSSLFPPMHHVQPTVASERRQMPRRTTDGSLACPPREAEKKAPTRPSSAAENDRNGRGSAKGSARNTARRDESHGQQPSARQRKPQSPSGFKETMAVQASRRKTTAARVATKESRETTLRQIEEVLDGLNKGAKDIAARGGGPDNVLVRGIPRPNTGVKGLIDMVNTVMSELQS